MTGKLNLYSFNRVAKSEFEFDEQRVRVSKRVNKVHSAELIKLWQSTCQTKKQNFQFCVANYFVLTKMATTILLAT